MPVADLPGGPGWFISGSDLKPKIADVEAFTAALVDDPALPILLELWSGKPEAALAAADAIPEGALSTVRLEALRADALRDAGRTDEAVAMYRGLFAECCGTAREAVIAQHYAKAQLVAGEYHAAYALFDRVFRLRKAKADDTVVASSQQGLQFMAEATGWTVRDATTDDAAAVAEIYGHAVSTSVATFEFDPPSAAEMADRITAMQVAGEWLVAETSAGQVVGYVSCGQYKPRAAYAHSMELSVYLSPDHVGAGLGRLLYAIALERACATGAHVVIGGVSQPNEASMALHESFGFQQVALLPEVGRKFDRWVDVALMHRTLDTSMFL